jgi:hypothetical protein
MSPATPPRGLVWHETWKGAVFEARTPYRRLYGLALFMLGVAVLVPFMAFVPQQQQEAIVVYGTTPFALAAVWLVYNGLAYFMGAARIRLGKDALDAAWRPLPAPGGARVPTRGIVGFEARARGARGALTWVAVRITGASAPRFFMQMFDEDHAAFVVARLNAALARLTRIG